MDRRPLPPWLSASMGILLLLCPVAAWCGEGSGDAAAAMASAFAGDDRDAKIQALRDLLASGLADDDVVPALWSARSAMTRPTPSGAGAAQAHRADAAGL